MPEREHQEKEARKLETALRLGAALDVENLSPQRQGAEKPGEDREPGSPATDDPQRETNKSTRQHEKCRQGALVLNRTGQAVAVVRGRGRRRLLDVPGRELVPGELDRRPLEETVPKGRAKAIRIATNSAGENFRETKGRRPCTPPLRSETALPASSFRFSRSSVSPRPS